MITTEHINPAVFLGTGPCTLQTATGPVSYAVCSTVANQQNRRVLSLLNPAEGKYYAGIGMIDDGGTGSYEGLNLSAQKRMSRGLSASANYTWSHCISDPYSDNPSSTAQVPQSPVNNRRLYRGNCIGIDVRQLFGMTLVATAPKFSNRALRILASDWQVAPMLQIKSAQFFSVYAGPDRALTAVPSQPADLVNPNARYPKRQTTNNWINASAFAPAVPGTYGNMGYNNMKGPGVFQLNMALSRTFAITEGRSIQLRAEAFNLPNHLNPFTPGIGPTQGGQRGGNVPLTAPNFGQITSDISGNNGLSPGDYRVIQFAMKYLF